MNGLGFVSLSIEITRISESAASTEDLISTFLKLGLRPKARFLSSPKVVYDFSQDSLV